MPMENLSQTKNQNLLIYQNKKVKKQNFCLKKVIRKCLMNWVLKTKKEVEYRMIGLCIICGTKR